MDKSHLLKRYLLLVDIAGKPPPSRPYSPVARAPIGMFGMSAVFLRFLLPFTLYFRNPIDATLAPLSNFKNSRCPPAHDLTIQFNIIVSV